MMFILLTGLCGCSEKTVTSVESMRLSTNSYNSGGTVYEISNKDGKIELCRYHIVYSGADEDFKLEQSAICDTQEFCELMNTCGVTRWNGFNKDDWGVLDGTSFSFTAAINEGETISADGYAEFPKGYSEFVAGLENLIEEYATIETEEVTEYKAVEPITELGWMVLSISYCDGNIAYETTEKDGKTELCRYRITDTSEKTEQSAICDTQELIELINNCKVAQWDGFFKEKEDTSDSTVFTFNASIANENEFGWKYIGAGGCDEFPDGYAEFVAGLENILKEKGNIVSDNKTPEPIISVESMKLSTGSYHSGGTVYEIENQYGEIQLSCYREVNSGGDEQELVLEKSAICDTQDFIEIMNTCKVNCWDGFNRENHLVLDGASFTFSATVNNGQFISAKGYAKTPDGYGEFVAELNKLLEESE